MVVKEVKDEKAVFSCVNPKCEAHDRTLIEKEKKNETA